MRPPQDGEIDPPEFERPKLRVSDYEAWTSGVQHPAQPLLVYAEAVDTVGHAIEFVAPEDASYAAILLNDNASAVDVAVEIRLSPPMVEACV
jgi:hypothetical protein